MATCDAKVIGWIHAFKALYIESKSFIEIGGLVVDENHRGKGACKTKSTAFGYEQILKEQKRINSINILALPK